MTFWLNYNSFDEWRVSKREIRCWQSECRAFTESKVITEKIAKGYFYSLCSLEAKLLVLGQIWGHVIERASKELSNALNCGAVSLLVPELYVPICIKMSKTAKVDLWWPQVAWPLTWPKKWPNQFRHAFWRSFECHLLHSATWSRSRVRGGVQTPRPGAFGARAPAQNGLWCAPPPPVWK